MANRFLYIDAIESSENTYVNIFEVFQRFYLSYFNKIYTAGLDHSDIVELAEKDSYFHFSKLTTQLKQFSSDTPLLHGPRECLIEIIEAFISVGQNYQIELVLIDCFNDEILGRLDLSKYVKITNPKTGEAELKVDNDECLVFSSIILLRQSVLCLRISGSIRINSPIKIKARFNGDL
ncbi:hypothetical protein [Colwellia sp. RSH04]|uniref:hypothetical protein n=1 Tax=Colwellia sp. RSH04 TaxID=2305464 RepID=UPI000E57F1EC|nr:hypothetical protein [Colwellia sp. RSH04]RHW77810.1 hypothetical protein D1094_02475 [Colwellia sp. RSH04]